MSEIACIVEGAGDVAAVPVLIRRICASANVHPPIRIAKSRVLQPNELERAVQLAVWKTAGKGAILLLVDADDDCPAEIGPRLLERLQAARSDVSSAAVIAKSEFEAWFLAAAESIRGKRGLPHDLVAPVDPESIRGAKEWLSRHMPPGRSYRETLDQPALAAVFDLGQARRAPSFEKFEREILRICGELTSS
jgi:hypothetical protein